jgi:protein O-GlcNAc transferase
VGFFDCFKKAPAGSTASSEYLQQEALELIARGNALEDTGELAQALELYGRAIDLAPGLARGHLNRGNALLACGDLDGAWNAFTTALKLDPSYAGAHFNLGNTCARLGRLDAAQAAYIQAIALNSNFADAEVALGAVLDDQGQFEKACVHYRRAIAIQPQYAQAHCNLGKSLKELGQFEAAVVSYQRAVEIDPTYAEGHSNLGGVLKDLGRLQEAQACYHRALELKPDFPDAHSNLLFLLNYGDDEPASPQLSQAQQYGEQVARRTIQYTRWNQSAAPERCLRVGFVSGDFRDHPVSYFFESVLGALVKGAGARMQCVAYCNHVQNDQVTQRLRPLFHSWHLTTGLSDSVLAQRLHEDAIDILIDLSGHTAHNRLPVFAAKPAPVQVSWLGYFGTTGVAAIDYLIADPWTLPPSEECNFTEKIWRLPETRLCFTPPIFSVELTPPPVLRTACLTFGCFNNLSKMTGQVVALWARVLAAVPDSRLFLKSPQLKEASVQRYVRETFAAHGIEPERLILEGLSSRAEYLGCYQRVDIALDPFPYTGGTTTVEALWMGVPVLTLQGERFLSRQGVGLLMNAGLPEWIASNPEDYVLRAARHAGDLQALARLRGVLRQQVLASPIFNATDFAHHFEAALRGMWHVWCAQQQDLLSK